MNEAKTINTSRTEKKFFKIFWRKIALSISQIAQFLISFSQEAFVNGRNLLNNSWTLFFDGRPTKLRPSLIWDISTIPRNPIRPESPKKNLFSQISSSYHAKIRILKLDMIYCLLPELSVSWLYTFRDETTAFVFVKFTFYLLFLFYKTTRTAQEEK